MKKFVDCTVLTIAHRILTRAHYDRVIVMDKGRMVEYDSSYRLLVEYIEDDKITSKGELFADTVRSTGKSN